MALPAYFGQSPLRHKAFRVFYAGAIGTALGYTMQTTVAAWLMATLSTSPVMVALVQTASTAPALLFGLFGGAMADIVDRRKVIVATQVVLIGATALLGAVTLLGWVGPSPTIRFSRPSRTVGARCPPSRCPNRPFVRSSGSFECSTRARSPRRAEKKR